MQDKQWTGTTYGNGWMHRHLIHALRYIDVRIMYVFAYIFIIPVVLLVNYSRRTSYSFYRDILRYGRLKSMWMVYANHCRFAENVVDKFAMYAGKKFKVQIEGLDKFNTLAAKNEGFLHMSSHIGNYEIAGYSISTPKVINAVVYAFEKASVMEGRSDMFSKTNVRMITMKEDMSHLFEIDQAVCRGEIVSFPTDRCFNTSRSIAMEFLGKTAHFPQGPFSVATMRDLDVLAVNVMKEGWTKYHIYVTPLPYDRSTKRAEQMKQLSAAYVAELERMVLKYPSQWYNFFDFWA